MNDTFSFTLESPLTEEQINLITDAEFEHTDRIWFDTPKGKHIEFVKAPQWIPCSERLPDKVSDDKYEVMLVLDEDRESVELGVYYDGQWIGLMRRSRINVAAWYPLPRLKPWEEEE